MANFDQNIVIKIELGDIRWNGTLKDIVQIDRNKPDLEDDLSSHAQIVGWFSVLAATALSTVEDIKDRLDRKSTDLDLVVRNKLDATKEKYTETKIRNLIESNPDFIDLKNRLAIVRPQYNILTAIVNTLNHRKDMLIQLSANRRKESV